MSRGRTILCSAMPRSTRGLLFPSRLMWSYMSASMSQKAIVLSPTSACNDQAQSLGCGLGVS